MQVRIRILWVFIIVAGVAIFVTLYPFNPLTLSPVQGQASNSVDIVPGASNPNSKLWYNPPFLTIVVGQSVSWTNHDASLHTVTAGDFYSGPITNGYDSGIMNSGEISKPWTFTTPGTYNYYCTLHPFMRGTIFVNSVPP
jgi:nitrite reductase (NO-forming)